MKKAIIIFSISIILLFSCRSDEPILNYEQFSEEFSQIQTVFKEKVKTAKSGDEYASLMKEKTRKLERLLERSKNTPVEEKFELLKGKILLHLSKFEEAGGKIDPIIKHDSKLATEAKMVKVQVLLMQRKVPDALPIFQSIEEEIKPGEDKYTSYLFFAFSGPSNEIRTEYCNKFLAVPDLPQEFLRYRTQIYAQLANQAEGEGDLRKARSLLLEAMGKSDNPRQKQSLQTKIDQLDLIGKSAVPVTGETWLNSRPLDISRLRGKVVLIDFWAPWCNPCRSIIPLLSEFYRKFGPEKLIVIGITKLYGVYRDELENKGKVTKEEEINLITEFIKRHKIPYPVTITNEGETFEKYFVVPIPTLVFVDAAGKIDFIKIGSNQPELIEQKIRSLLSAI